MSVKWIELKEYNSYEKEHYSSKNRFIEETASFSVDHNFLENIILTEPYLSQDEEYGLTKTWFGITNGHLFVLMTHPEAQKPLTILGAENFQTLSELTDLGADFFANTRWIYGNAGDATHSVFTTDDLGVTLEVFRAKKQEDAELMAGFLNLKGKTVSFYVDPAEDLSQGWGVYEKFSEKKVAESPDRASAEYFGIEYEKKHGTPTFISKLVKE